MPRRKRTFIRRSTACTYHVVRQPTSDNPNRHVLVSDNGSNDAGFRDIDLDNNSIVNTYQTRDFELGEYGLPDDGYDYSKHFKTIGGLGGVYISAVTSLPDPDAVSKAKESSSANPRSALIGLGAGAEKSDDIDVYNSDLRDPHASEMKKAALDEIERDRKRHSSLDEIISLLDDDENASTHEKSEHTEETAFSNNDPEEAAQDQLDDLESEKDHDKYFSALVNEGAEIEAVPKPATESKVLKGVVEKYNEPRLLDAQFDNFMKSFESDSSDDSDLAELRRHAQSEISEGAMEDNIFALLNANEKGGYEFGIEEPGLLEGFAELKMDSDGDELPTIENRQLPKNSSTEDAEAQNRKSEVEGYREAEFEKGMAVLLDSYTRVSACEALEMKEGLEGAKQALRRQEREDIARFEEKAALDIESDGRDSELDTLFEEQYGDKGEQWDCETILSTYTNTDNHPSVIDESSGRKRRPVRKRSVIQLDPQTQAPADFMPEAVMASTHADVDFGSRRPDAAKCNVRSKKESKEEKRARKAAVKEAARERRALKSEMKTAFAAENVKQGKHGASLGTAKVAVQF